MCNTCNTCMIWGARFWHLKFGWSQFYISQAPCSTNPLTMKWACSQVHPHSVSAFLAEISVYRNKYHTFSLQNVIPNVRRFSRLSTWECRFIPQVYIRYLQFYTGSKNHLLGCTSKQSFKAKFCLVSPGQRCVHGWENFGLHPGPLSSAGRSDAKDVGMGQIFAGKGQGNT